MCRTQHGAKGQQTQSMPIRVPPPPRDRLRRRLVHHGRRAGALEVLQVEAERGAVGVLLQSLKRHRLVRGATGPLDVQVMTIILPRVDQPLISSSATSATVFALTLLIMAHFTPKLSAFTPMTTAFMRSIQRLQNARDFVEGNRTGKRHTIVNIARRRTISYTLLHKCVRE